MNTKMASYFLRLTCPDGTTTTDGGVSTLEQFNSYLKAQKALNVKVEILVLNTFEDKKVVKHRKGGFHNGI